jgi:hypothetical protein
MKTPLPLRVIKRPKLCLALGFVVCQSAFAQTWQSEVSLSNEKSLRGITVGRSSSSLGLGTHYYAEQKWFAGLAVDTVKLTAAQTHDVLLNADLGYQWLSESDWSGQVFFAHYAYPFKHELRNYKYDELGTALAFRNKLFLTLAWSPNVRAQTPGYAFQKTNDRFTLNAVWRETIAPRWTLNLGVGASNYQTFQPELYRFAQLGLVYQWQEWQCSLTYLVTDNTAKQNFLSRADNRFLAGIQVGF